VLADFTEATFGGYARVAVTRAQMGAPAIVANVAERTRSSAPEFTQTSGADQLVYGWLLITDTTEKIVFGQNFDTPRTMSIGAKESIDPFKIKLKSFT